MTHLIGSANSNVASEVVTLRDVLKGGSGLQCDPSKSTESQNTVYDIIHAKLTPRMSKVPSNQIARCFAFGNTAGELSLLCRLLIIHDKMLPPAIAIGRSTESKPPLYLRLGRGRKRLP